MSVNGEELTITIRSQVPQRIDKVLVRAWHYDSSATHKRQLFAIV